jgi:hypothetical protein
VEHPSFVAIEEYRRSLDFAALCLGMKLKEKFAADLDLAGVV